MYDAHCLRVGRPSRKPTAATTLTLSHDSHQAKLRELGTCEQNVNM
jgi:hypothetical protein